MERFVQIGKAKAGYLKPAMEIIDIAPNAVVLTSCTEYKCRQVSFCEDSGCDDIDVNCVAECFSYIGAGCYPTDSGCGKDGDCLEDVTSG